MGERYGGAVKAARERKERGEERGWRGRKG